MHCGYYAAQLVQIASGHKEIQGEFALRFPVQRADDFAQIVNLSVGGTRPCACF